MNTTLPTVTVAISAYNEADNIGAFIKSVLVQKENGYILSDIWILSDGSTDNTVKIAKSFNNAKVRVIEYNERAGKSQRLNQLYTMLKSDILVQSDADVILAHPDVLHDIITPMINDNKVGMCGGDPTPVKAETFTEKAINCTFEPYHLFRRTLRGGNNVFSADGRLLAYRKEFIKSVTIPIDMIANDAFTYFCCITRGYLYRYAQNAVVHFRSPQTLKDHVKQNTRFLAAHTRLERYFSPAIVHREFAIPADMVTANLAKQYIRHPILCSYIFLVNRYCKLKARLIERHMTAVWQIAKTTKSI